MVKERARLYLITPPQITLPTFVMQCKSAFDGGDVACLQIRLKDENYQSLHDDDFKRATAVLLPLCREYGVELLLNDKVHLVKKLGADGVHLGEDDLPVGLAREQLGDGYTIGASCYASRHRAMETGEQGADYVAFGQFHPTATKPPRGVPDIEILSWWRQFTVLPSVAIGGMTPTNSAPMVRAGADFIAVVSAVWNHPQGPAQAVKAFNDLFDSIVKE